MDDDLNFLLKAIELASRHCAEGDCGPFGAVIVKDGKVIAEGWNQVVSALDPTAHAEVLAIRKACQQIGDFSLQGCTLYSSCEPCPMCFSASVWARLDRVVYSSTRFDAARAGFDDELIYRAFDLDDQQNVILMEQIVLEEAEQLLNSWDLNANKIKY